MINWSESVAKPTLLDTSRLSTDWEVAITIHEKIDDVLKSLNSRYYLFSVSHRPFAKLYELEGKSDYGLVTDIDGKVIGKYPATALQEKTLEQLRALGLDEEKYNDMSRYGLEHVTSNGGILRATRIYNSQTIKSLRFQRNIDRIGGGTQELVVGLSWLVIDGKRRPSGISVNEINNSLY